MDNHSLVRRLRTLERASLRAGKDSLRTGARPAQGSATTTGDGLVRTLERASLRAGEDSLRTGARPTQGSATTTDVDLRVECGWGVRRLRGGLPAHVDVYYAGVSL